jgi:hypothetical protein
MALTYFFKDPSAGKPFSFSSVLATIVIIIVLSIGMTHISIARLHQRPELLNITQKEVGALGSDFLKVLKLSPESFPSRNLHKRIYTFVKKYKIDSIHHENFWNLTKQGLAEQRAQFFIDPWNTPYWIQQICDLECKKRKIFIYSFGPNRRRDSVLGEISGDDFGVQVYSTF